MSELKIGDKVKIGATGVTGTVVLADPQGYHVEHVNDSGNLIRRIFIIEDLSRADEETGNGESSVKVAGGEATETGNEKPGTTGTDANASNASASGDASKGTSGDDKESLVGSGTQPATFNLADGTTLDLADQKSPEDEIAKQNADAAKSDPTKDAA